MRKESSAINQVYNAAVGGRTSLNQLYDQLPLNLLLLYAHLKRRSASL